MNERSSSFIRDNQDSHHLTKHLALIHSPCQHHKKSSLSVPTQVNQLCLQRPIMDRTAFRLLRQFNREKMFHTFGPGLLFKYTLKWRNNLIMCVCIIKLQLTFCCYLTKHSYIYLKHYRLLFVSFSFIQVFSDHNSTTQPIGDPVPHSTDPLTLTWHQVPF